MEVGELAKERCGSDGKEELVLWVQLTFWSMDTNTCATVWLETACAAAAEQHTRQPLHHHHHLARKHCTHQEGLCMNRNEVDSYKLEFFKSHNAVSAIYCKVHCTSNRHFG